MQHPVTLCDLRPGETAQVRALYTEGGMRRRLTDIGLIPGSRVCCVGRSPGGAAAPPQRPQAAENRPQGGLGCALWLRFAAAGIGKYWRSGAAGMGIEMIRAKFF